MRQVYSRKRKRRTATGSAIAEGAAMLPVIVAISVAMILFIFYVGFSLYYHVKLAFVANQVASYAASKLTGYPGTAEDQAVVDECQANANHLCDALGLPHPTISARETASDFTVVLKLSSIKILNGIVPNLPIVESGIALISGNRFTHYATIQIAQIGGPVGGNVSAKMYVPVYRVDGLFGTGGGRVPRGMFDSTDTGVNYQYGSDPPNCWTNVVKW